jgi:hypothetical protein
MTNLLLRIRGATQVVLFVSPLPGQDNQVHDAG